MDGTSGALNSGASSVGLDQDARSRPLTKCPLNGVLYGWQRNSEHRFFSCLMCRLHEEKLSRVEGAPAYPSRLSKCPLFFFMFGFAILKDFLYLFVAKFTGRKLYR